MIEEALQSENTTASARIRALLLAFRHVGLPLLQALNDSSGAGDQQNLGVDVEKFGSLVEGSVALSRALSENLGASIEECDAWVRWAVVGSSSQIVGTRYQATGALMSDDDARGVATIITQLQERFKVHIPADSETVPNTLAVFRAKMVEAMVPVVGAVARYSFGQAEHGLLAEVAERLVRNADQITRSVAPAESTPEEWRILCWSVMRAAGQIYADCHYAEADRLLYMEPDARAAYFAQHGNMPPMTQVWQAFTQRMAMLSTLATYLDVPPLARLEGEAGL